MALGCSSKFAKYFLFFFNVLFWICGAAVLGVGIWILTDKNALNLMQIATGGLDSSDPTVKGAAITLVVVGFIIFITGFLGCCGAMRESSCMLMMYTFIVGFILLLQIVAGILAAVFRDKVEAGMEKSMNETVMSKYGQIDQEGLTESWDYMQKEFKCCGATDGPKDWENSLWKSSLKNDTVKVPESCCKTDNLKMCWDVAYNTSIPERSDFIYTNGCKEELLDWIKNHAGIIIGVAFGLAVFQVLVIIMACCLRKAITNQYEYV